jgi:serine protease AprX
MKRCSIPAYLMRVAVVGVLVLLSNPASPQLLPLPLPGGGATQPLQIDPLLSSALQSLRPGQSLQVVLTFGGYPAVSDLLAIRAAGVQFHEFRTLPMVAVRGTRLQILGLLALPGLRSAYLNRELDYFLDESVPLVGARRVHDELGLTGLGVTVAVIDSGIDATHADLPFGTKVIQNVKLAPNLFGTAPLALEGLANTDTTSGHGTHVAGTVAGTGAALGGKYRGVAPGARLVGVGAGETLFILTALEGFDWVMQNRQSYGIRVISNSWGTTGEFAPDDPINVASRIARDAGLVVLFAAGNEGPGANTLNPYCVAQWVICVAAGNKDGRTLAGFSSRGVAGDPVLHPTVTAPGVDIASARATTGIVINAFFAVDVVDLGADAVSYAVASGTSMATPHVAGAVALLLEANPALTPDQVKAALEATAIPMPGLQRHEVGAGYLNAFEAVRASFTFTGRQVSWIGLNCSACGIATVSIDGVAAGQVNTAGPAAPGTPGLASNTVFTALGLPAGSHTLTITVTGNTTTGGAHIILDAFDVTP